MSNLSFEIFRVRVNLSFEIVALNLQVVDVRHVEDQIDVIEYDHGVVPQQFDRLGAVQEQDAFDEDENELHENGHDVDGRQSILQNELRVI